MPALHAPGVRFELLAITRPCLVDADAAHLEDVVRILLENAVKFSADKPRIRVELLSAEGRVLVKVSDAGVGLPPERIASLFEPYSIVDVVHHSSGSGLHLAIAQLIVLAHGGDIRVESPGPGKGSTFTVSLPSAHSTHRAYSRTEAAGGDPT
jgi:signal transduction histidine kinase